MSLSLEGIHKKVAGEVHLADIDLVFPAGSFHVILGRTLAGKTSLLRIIAGLDRPSAGRLILNGRDITRAPVRSRSVAMVYQQFINYPSFTVFDNIASPLRLEKAANIKGRVHELAAMLRIEHLLDRLPGQLSGGQQQRVAIARALAKRAELLLLDEPLVNLDYKLREELREELRIILRERAVTVLYATTDPAEALAMGGETIVLHEGRVLQHAPALRAYHRPASVAAARLLSDPPMNLFDVTVAGKVAELSPSVRIPLRGHLADLADGGYRFGIRASDCSLARAAEDSIAVRGRVELNEISGSETFVYLRHGEVSFILQEDGVFQHELGSELTFYLDPQRLLAFAAPGARPGTGSEARQDGELVASYRSVQAA